MNPRLQPIQDREDDAGQLVQVMLVHKSMEAENMSRAIGEIELRANKVGSVMEGILHEAHVVTRWGLNE